MLMVRRIYPLLIYFACSAFMKGCMKVDKQTTAAKSGRPSCHPQQVSNSEAAETGHVQYAACTWTFTSLHAISYLTVQRLERAPTKVLPQVHNTYFYTLAHSTGLLVLLANITLNY